MKHVDQVGAGQADGKDVVATAANAQAQLQGAHSPRLANDPFDGQHIISRVKGEPARVERKFQVSCCERADG